MIIRNEDHLICQKFWPTERRQVDIASVLSVSTDFGNYLQSLHLPRTAANCYIYRPSEKSNGQTVHHVCRLHTSDRRAACCGRIPERFRNAGNTRAATCRKCGDTVQAHACVANLGWQYCVSSSKAQSCGSRRLPLLKGQACSKNFAALAQFFRAEKRRRGNSRHSELQPIPRCGSCND